MLERFNINHYDLFNINPYLIKSLRMGNFRPPATSNQKDSDWERIEIYVKEERPLQPFRKIVVKGSVDMLFRRYDKPMLMEAGETAEAVASVKTSFNGGNW